MGRAGDVNIQAQSIFFKDTNLSTGTSGQGDAGNVSIQAESLFLNDSFVNTTTEGRGDAGDIFVQADNLVSVASLIISSQVLHRLDFQLLAQQFRQWASSTFETQPDELVAIDGKSIKGTVREAQTADQNFVSVVSVYSSELGAKAGKPTV